MCEGGGVEEVRERGAGRRIKEGSGRGRGRDEGNGVHVGV